MSPEPHYLERAVLPHLLSSFITLSHFPALLPPSSESLLLGPGCPILQGRGHYTAMSGGPERHHPFSASRNFPGMWTEDQLWCLSAPSCRPLFSCPLYLTTMSSLVDRHAGSPCTNQSESHTPLVPSCLSSYPLCLPSVHRTHLFSAWQISS